MFKELQKSLEIKERKVKTLEPLAENILRNEVEKNRKFFSINFSYKEEIKRDELVEAFDNMLKNLFNSKFQTFNFSLPYENRAVFIEKINSDLITNLKNIKLEYLEEIFSHNSWIIKRRYFNTEKELILDSFIISHKECNDSIKLPISFRDYYLSKNINKNIEEFSHAISFSSGPIGKDFLIVLKPSEVSLIVFDKNLKKLNSHFVSPIIPYPKRTYVIFNLSEYFFGSVLTIFVFPEEKNEVIVNEILYEKNNIEKIFVAFATVK